jgi:transposase
MEATNSYWEPLAETLRVAGHSVSVVNPKRIKKYAEAQMQRSKTDAQFALLLVDYCCRQAPPAWTPMPPAYQTRRAMVRYLNVLKKAYQPECNRRSTARSALVRQTIDTHLAFLQEQIAQLQQQINAYIDADPQMQADKALLTSIPGVGDMVACTFMAEVPDITHFAQARQLATYAGLTPSRRESGISLHCTDQLVKWGNKHLRSVLHMPALSAHVHNPLIAALKARLEARGKSKSTTVVAPKRRLLHLCYGALKTRQPFDLGHALSVATT